MPLVVRRGPPPELVWCKGAEGFGANSCGGMLQEASRSLKLVVFQVVMGKDEVSLDFLRLGRHGGISVSTPP